LAWPKALVGERILAVVKRQFEALRDGDRFWYANDPAFTEADRQFLENRRLGHVIKDNTGIDSVPDDVFLATVPPTPDGSGFACLAAPAALATLSLPPAGITLLRQRECHSP